MVVPKKLDVIGKQKLFTEYERSSTSVRKMQIRWIYLQGITKVNLIRKHQKTAFSVENGHVEYNRMPCYFKDLLTRFHEILNTK